MTRAHITAFMFWCFMLGVLLGQLACGPKKRPTGPRARPDLHFTTCASWCPATARHLQTHVQKPR